MPILTLAICGMLGRWMRPSRGIRSWRVFVFDLKTGPKNTFLVTKNTAYAYLEITAAVFQYSILMVGTWAWCAVTPVHLRPHTSETLWGVPYCWLYSNSSCAPEDEKGVYKCGIPHTFPYGELHFPVDWFHISSTQAWLSKRQCFLTPFKLSVTLNWYQKLATHKMSVERGAITPHNISYWHVKYYLRLWPFG